MFEERSLRAGLKGHHPTSWGLLASRWLHQLQMGCEEGTQSPHREPEEVIEWGSQRRQAEPQEGGTCWHLPHLEPDLGSIRGCVGKHHGPATLGS